MRISDWSSDVCSADLLAHGDGDGSIEVRLTKLIERHRLVLRRAAFRGRGGAGAASQRKRQNHHGASRTHTAHNPPAGKCRRQRAMASINATFNRLPAEDRKSTRLNPSHYYAARMPS